MNATPGDVGAQRSAPARGLGRDEVIRWALALALFLAVFIWAAAVDTSQEYNDAQSAGFPWHWIAGGLACVAAGVIIRSWWAVLLMVVPLLIAAPFGYPTDPDLREPTPVWFIYLYFLPVEFPLLAIGALLGQLRSSSARLSITIAILLGIGACAPLSYTSAITDPTPDQPVALHRQDAAGLNSAAGGLNAIVAQAKSAGVNIPLNHIPNIP